MRRRTMILGLAVLVLAAGGLAAWLGLGGAQDAAAAPQVFASPIHAGCYIAAAGDCRIHVDQFTINVDDGNGDKLAHFQITANGEVIYDFKPDQFNPPIGDYTPSMVMQDFAATCGTTYQVNLSCQDTGDAFLFNCGQTTQFTCPSNVP